MGDLRLLGRGLPRAMAVRRVLLNIATASKVLGESRNRVSGQRERGDQEDSSKRGKSRKGGSWRKKRGEGGTN